MYDLIIGNDSCLFADGYPALESRLDGQFGPKDVHTRPLIKLDEYSSFLEINIKDLKYVLEILRHKHNKEDFQIRIFKENDFIIGRHYIIKEKDISMTRMFRCVLDDVNEQLEKKNSEVLSYIQKNYIIELIFKHLWRIS